MRIFDTLPPEYFVNVLHEDKFFLYFYKAWFVSLRPPLLGDGRNSSQEAQIPGSRTDRGGFTSDGASSRAPSDVSSKLN